MSFFAARSETKMGRLMNEFIIKLNELLKKHIFIFGTVHGRPVVPMALLVKVRAGIHLNWMPVSACVTSSSCFSLPLRVSANS